MRIILKLALAAVIPVVAVVSMAVPAWAHVEGPPAVDCQQVVETFDLFSAGPHTINSVVTVNDASKTFENVIYGPSGTVRLDINDMTQFKGHVTISALANWLDENGVTVYGQRATVAKDCGEMPTTTTIPATTTTVKPVPVTTVPVMPPVHHDYPPTTGVTHLVPPSTVVNTAPPTTQISTGITTKSLPFTGAWEVIEAVAAVGLLTVGALGASRRKRNER